MTLMYCCLCSFLLRASLFQRYGEADTTNADLEELTKNEINNVKKDYKANKDTVVDFLLKRSVAVDIGLMDVQKRYLRDMAAGRSAGYV